ncbi:YrdB family protein [Aeromicrobium sp.]|uniref:YrdB family protein n=1 Tax=Aeromicrobium sp. TaxID=1871063 RepID=UPI003D6B6406
MSRRNDEPRVGFADMVAFGCELAMFVLVIASVNYLVDGWRSWLIGIGAALVVALIWARWMAPTSSHRLTDPRRYVAQALLFGSVGVLAGVSGLLLWGVVFTVTSLVAFAFSRTERHAR